MRLHVRSRRRVARPGNGMLRLLAATGLFVVAIFTMAMLVEAQNVTLHDPGVRGGTIDSGQPLSTLTAAQGQFFADGLGRFIQVDSVSGNGGSITNEPGVGLGPRFNNNSCGGCHSQPDVGGTSPRADQFPFIGPNPQTQVFNLDGAQNTLPSFITSDGPVREARFKFFLNPDGSLSSNPDGGVHDLFVIEGRSDAASCELEQPKFSHNQALNNVIFRIPTPTFGEGLIENIPDETILANMNANAAQKQALGISGHPNHNGNDGTISRFGWKAQNKSLEIFAGEAYNVEIGVTNELFQNERPSPDEEQKNGLPASCKLNPTPEDSTNFAQGTNGNASIPSDTVQFAMFMRFLAPPTPSTTNPGGATSIANGREDFIDIGCAMCHTPTLKTAHSSFTSGLDNVNANLFSDLLDHHMGTNLADGVSQGGAGTDEFRSAPLWGLGQRIFFLHDGRTRDLLDAIEEHSSSGSEANTVIQNFNNLTPQQQQDLLNFLRSL
ncbi:MAG: di-heme oxidoredictase family protein [Candidatus Acidiferrales bacterium]